MRIALAGNPNSGKTTMYNALTGSNEKVGNWAGVTVDKKEAPIKRSLCPEKARLIAVDLPGAYSMSPFTSEESITSAYVKEENPDVIINIVDATNLSRSLFFTTQLLELGIPVVVALNKKDVNDKKETVIDSKLLSEKLGREILDTDEEIIKADGRSIPEIFSTDGEKIFRELETQAVKNVGKQLGKIIATGGGAVMKKENRDALGQNGTIIYLKKDLSLLSLDGRPLSKDEDAVRKIYEARKDTYEAFADFTVEVDADAQITTERVIECIF